MAGRTLVEKKHRQKSEPTMPVLSSQQTLHLRALKPMVQPEKFTQSLQQKINSQPTKSQARESNGV